MSGRQLEVSEVDQVDRWIADGTLSSLIDAALANGLRTRIYRLNTWSGRFDRGKVVELDTYSLSTRRKKASNAQVLMIWSPRRMSAGDAYFKLLPNSSIRSVLRKLRSIQIRPA